MLSLLKKTLTGGAIFKKTTTKFNRGGSGEGI
jgi:hypothetical protein